MNIDWNCYELRISISATANSLCPSIYTRQQQEGEGHDCAVMLCCISNHTASYTLFSTHHLLLCDDTRDVRHCAWYGSYWLAQGGDCDGFLLPSWSSSWLRPWRRSKDAAWRDALEQGKQGWSRAPSAWLPLESSTVRVWLLASVCKLGAIRQRVGDHHQHLLQCLPPPDRARGV